MMPVAKRKVAVAYEMIQLEPSNSFFKAGLEAEEALAELYKMNSSKIISKINEGALDAYKNSPVIASLIAYARSAAIDASQSGLPIMATTGNGIDVELVPVINIASLGDNGMLVSIDGNLFIQGIRGGLTLINDVSQISGIPSDTSSLILCLKQMILDKDNANIVSLREDILAMTSKNLGISTFSIDMLANNDKMIIVNGEPMSIDKTKILLNANKDSIIANILTSEGAKETLQLLNSIMDVFDKYRGAILTGRYAKKFVNGDISLYIVKGQNQYSTICFMAGSMISSTKYDTIYSLLADSNVISDQNLHNAISMEFMSEMKSEVNITTVQKSILRKIIDERQKYEDLLEKINNEETDLQNVVDPNPEKIKSLSDIKKRVIENLAKVNDEISKITK
jgi:hypothetical protein